MPLPYDAAGTTGQAKDPHRPADQASGAAGGRMGFTAARWPRPGWAPGRGEGRSAARDGTRNEGCWARADASHSSRVAASETKSLSALTARYLR